MKEVKDINLDEAKTTNDIIKQMFEGGGFTGKQVAEGVNILEDMQKDKECVKFLSFTSCIISTGTRGVILDLIKNKMVDVVITACGTLDHDLARHWKAYYHGDFHLDDKELHKKGLNRIGNILTPNDCYGEVLEEKLIPIIKEIIKEKKEWSTHELIWAIGEKIKDEPKADETLIYWCWKNKIPMIIPGPTDASFGSQLWMIWQNDKDFKLNLFEDEQKLSDIIFEAKKSGALMIGGGISKHHVIWWNQFRQGLDYAVQITTAQESDGSLSGAETREAISWGKIKEKAKHVTIHDDATSVLPFMIKALKERLNK